MGKGFMRHGSILAPNEQRERIESITLADMRQVASEMLDADTWSLLVFQS
jgi:hypothetical protein